ncbi:MAG: two-component sensor histidine kinase [Tolypothrix brevis GSE-NOS-MK-07-07A]|nr:two-component sensor histidine kinase [Tolypothrix brevis GSE-NOS-MK-07-07A]
MTKPSQSSFRRILVSRILLLFVPVLLAGEILALNKARSSLLETARKNLTESSQIKGEKIVDAIASLKSNLLSASQTTVIKSGSPWEAQQFLNQLAEQLPTHIECIQLANLRNGNIIASTCGDEAIAKLKLPLPNDEIEIEAISPSLNGKTGKKDSRHQLQLLLSAPVYDRFNNLHYALRIKTYLHQQIKNKRGSLTGSTVVIAEDGTILAHPLPGRVGTNIKQHPDASRLEMILKHAIAGKQDSVTLYFKEGEEKEGIELVAGYTAIPSPITNKQQQKWIVLAVTSLDNALFGLGEIKLILLALTFGLISVSVLASLYLGRYLARPVEQLRDYALNLNSHHSAELVPHNFKIKEFNQLAQALNQMVERLKAWAEELEIAWKEAKNANNVKSKFVATTSHELRNPLHTIINCVRIVRDGMCDSREEEMEYLLHADQAAIHLLGIINDLLDLSKIEEGKLSVVTEPIDLRKLLQEVINLQSVNVQKKGLKFKIDLGQEVIAIRGDAAKLKQVLINVIGNATKFTETGSIAIATEIENSFSQSQVIITITDTGVGIEPAQQHKLFRPFVMADNASTRKFEGTGLGLAISRNLIELMKGTITLDSAGINQGTTIAIALPLIDASLLSTSAHQEVSDQTGVNQIREIEEISSQEKIFPPPREVVEVEKSDHRLPPMGSSEEIGIWREVRDTSGANSLRTTRR